MTPSESDQPSDPSSASDVPDENQYYVLRRGEILGPFREDQLPELVAGGLVEYDDFVQQAGSSEWLPLRWLLIPNDAQDLEGALAPTWRTLLKWSWLRLRYNLDEQSLSAGWVCLGLALAGLFLSRWPMLLWAPWAVLAFFGGIALYRRQQPGPGIALMLAAAIVPGGLWAYFWSTAPTVTVNAAPAPIAVISAPAPIQKPAAEAQPATASAPLPPPPPPITAIPGLVPAAALEKPALQTPTPVTPQPAPAPASEPAPTAPAPTQAAASASKIIADYATQIGAKVSEVTSRGTAPDNMVSNIVPSPLKPTPRIPATTISKPARTEDAIYVVKTDKGSGSGFAVKLGDRTYIVTNYHVVEGAKTVKFSSSVHTFEIEPTSVIEVANDRDLVRIPIPLSAALEIRGDASIGEEIQVYGNPGGDGVITVERGTLIGNGANEIEVSAEFIPGNSGGPITDKSGDVMGVATYVLKQSGISDWITKDTRFEKARRFGVRVGNSLRWAPTNWRKLSDDGKLTFSVESYQKVTGKLAHSVYTRGSSSDYGDLPPHPMLARTNFNQALIGEIKSLSAIRSGGPRTFYYYSELDRADNLVRTKMRGMIGSLGNCLSNGAIELERIPIAYVFGNPYSKSRFLDSVKEIRELGEDLIKARNEK